MEKDYVKFCMTVCCIVAMLGPMPAGAQQAPLPLSLKDVAVPEPPDLADYVADKAAAIALGKALYWDMQVGSDNVVACATCHFNAGGDIRTKNQISPGLLDGNFSGGPSPIYPSGDVTFGNSFIPDKPGNPNFGTSCVLTAADFPLHKRTPATAKVPRPEAPFFTPVADEFASVERDTNDVVSSQGVRLSDFVELTAKRRSLIELSPIAFDPLFFLDARNLTEDPRLTSRRVEPRNSPTVINAAFNFDNFWDGRASAIFNGVNPFGFRDRDSTLRKGDRNDPSAPLSEVKVRIIHSSLASQAVGPPLSDFEMSSRNRSFPMLARKLLALRPLAKQRVSPLDSALGSLARRSGGKGLGVSNYSEMVKAAFQPEWWSSTQPVDAPGGPYTQMEWNFSLFFGLSVQLYEATLIADDTPFDRFMGAALNVRGGGAPVPADPNALTVEEKLGLDIFMGTNISGRNPGFVDGGCMNCHALPETTNFSVRNVQADNNGVPQKLIEVMIVGDNRSAFYDNGMYNVGVRPTSEDIGRGGTAPFTNPLTGENFPLSYVELSLLKSQGLLPEDVASFVPDLPNPCANGLFLDIETGLCNIPPPEANRRTVMGGFKVPSLRNVEFTGPYMHNGGDATLRQVVEFYVRGGNFPASNFDDLDVDIAHIPDLDTSSPDPVQAAAAEVRIKALVAFLSRGLTDERVQFNRAPFDHPELIIPDGPRPRNPSKDKSMRLRPVGQNGQSKSIPRFLNLDPQTP